MQLLAPSPPVYLPIIHHSHSTADELTVCFPDAHSVQAPETFDTKVPGQHAMHALWPGMRVDIPAEQL